MASAAQGFKWKPPDSPDHKDYRELLAFLEELKKRDLKKGLAWFAAVAETDFWFWQWQVMSLGRLEIKDPGHKHFGRLWVMEPWFFDRMREVQSDFDTGRSNVLYQFARGMFKSSAIQKGGILWFLAKDRSDTHALFTHKKDTVGEGFGKDLKGEIESNHILRAHWPQFRNPRELSTTQITLDRPPGIREPSIAIYGILTSAASGHFRKIWVDDGVAPEEHSPVVLKEIDSRLSMMGFIGHDDTQRFWIGVPSCEEDPIEQRRKKGGFFSLVRRHPGILPGGKYPLRSRAWYEDLRSQVREDHFASQVMLEIVPPGSRYFREEWLRRYHGTPEQAARGCRIHIILDPAEGKKEGKAKLSDFLIIRVVAFTYDKQRRNLDLWRERIGIAEAMDILLGPTKEDLDAPENLWKPVGGLVRKWKKYDPLLTVWVENVGASSFDQTIKREMRFRAVHDAFAVSCTVRELRSNVKKESRIAYLQPDYRNGLISYPATGFGHGSFTIDDKRDTLDQFIQDELKQWTLSGDILNDDMLDSEAWPSQPKASFNYPETPAEILQGSFLAMESKLAEGGASGPEASWVSASWRVM